MYEVWLVCQIIGRLMMCVGAYLIGNFWIVVGLFFVLWGKNIQEAVKKGEPIRPDKPSKSWIGD